MSYKIYDRNDPLYINGRRLTLDGGAMPPSSFIGGTGSTFPSQITFNPSAPIYGQSGAMIPNIEDTGTGTKPETDVPKTPSSSSSSSEYKYFTPFSQTDAGMQLWQDYLNKLGLYNGKEGFSFSKSVELNDLYDQISKYPDFNYDLNADALYDQYVDQYTRLGNLASQDVMGQAAALTGGYGNSNALGVSQQQYNAYLQELNNIVPQLEKRAYDRHTQGKEDLYNQYALLDSERQKELGVYNAELEKLYKDAMLAGDTYTRAENEYNTGWDVNNSEEWKNKEFNRADEWHDEDIKIEAKRIADEKEASKPTTVYSGGGFFDGQEVPKVIAGNDGLTTTDTKFFDSNGKLKDYTYSTESQGSILDGGSATVTWNIGGSTVKYPKGVNPHTGEKNPDVKYGVMGEGNDSYIPNNIANVPIEEHKKNGMDEHAWVNGKQMKIYKCGGILVVWDDVNNKWQEV